MAAVKSVERNTHIQAVDSDLNGCCKYSKPLDMCDSGKTCSEPTAIHPEVGGPKQHMGDYYQNLQLLVNCVYALPQWILRPFMWIKFVISNDLSQSDCAHHLGPNLAFTCTVL